MLGMERRAMVSGWGYRVRNSAKESYVCLFRVSRNVTQDSLRLHMQMQANEKLQRLQELSEAVSITV